jgi:DNA polymerase III alpha subunit
MTWRLPDQYYRLDILHRVFDDFEDRLKSLKYTEAQIEVAAKRITDEIDEIEQRGMKEFMRTIIYVLDTFREKGIVWGVGRGSSCACYILFVLGLHAVDCVLHEIPLEEFFHD